MGGAVEGEGGIGVICTPGGLDLDYTAEANGGRHPTQPDADTGGAVT